MANVTVQKDRYTVDSVYQWDKDQELVITGLSLASIPEIHFTNDAMDKAIVRQSTMDDAGVITAEIPNSLLQKPYKIRAYVCIYERETFKSLYLITIPVEARSMPNDYTITSDDGEVYSFNALENQVLNLIASNEKLSADVKNSNAQLESKLKSTYNTAVAEIKASNEELEETINNTYKEMVNMDMDSVSEAELEEYLENNSQTMGTLTINGQQYNGSEDVVIEVGSGSGGGGSETAQEVQLATGTIATGTEAYSIIDTGVTLATLKQYKRFVFVLKGASNVALANTYLTFATSNKWAIVRSSAVGGMVYGYEWLNRETSLLRVYGLYQGNPSLVRNIGSNFVVTTVGLILTDGLAGGGSIVLFDLSDVEDTETLKIYISNATTIDYSWEVRGLTV